MARNGQGTFARDDTERYDSLRNSNTTRPPSLHGACRKCAAPDATQQSLHAQAECWRSSARSPAPTRATNLRQGCLPGGRFVAQHAGRWRTPLGCNAKVAVARQGTWIMWLWDIRAAVCPPKLKSRCTIAGATFASSRYRPDQTRPMPTAVCGLGGGQGQRTPPPASGAPPLRADRENARLEPESCPKIPKLPPERGYPTRPNLCVGANLGILPEARSGIQSRRRPKLLRARMGSPCVCTKQRQRTPLA